MKRTQIRQDFHLSFPGRPFFGFWGEIGAGKTTLIHLIAGLRKPTRGQVQVFGYDSMSPQARSKVGYLPERPYFYDHLTGDDLLKYLGALSGMKRSQIQARIPVVMESVGMS